MIKKYLIDTYGQYLTGLDIYENKTSIRLDKIIINPEFRDQGIGKKIMNDLIQYADHNKQIITLTPASDFGGNKNRLIQFYKSFGFKHNKGVHKAYEFSDTMIRYPKLDENALNRIKIGLREELNKLLNEKRNESSDLNDTTYLFEHNNKLVLYDTQFLKTENPIDGVIGFSVVGNDKGKLYMEIVGTRKGFGPLMYELTMQYVYPNKLSPDIEGNTSDGALRMWDYFMKGNNPDVEIETLNPGDKNYKEEIGKFDINENPEIMKIFNSSFSMNGSDYYVLESNTEEFLENIDNPREFILKLIHLGNEFFNSIY